MGAILSVNLLVNDIGVEQARALVIILKEHSTLKSLCGNNGDETELDMSGKMSGAEDAIMLAAETIDNEALSCEDGKYYHEWSLNSTYQQETHCVQAASQNVRVPRPYLFPFVTPTFPFSLYAATPFPYHCASPSLQPPIQLPLPVRISFLLSGM